jgi:hypothetical protein
MANTQLSVRWLLGLCTGMLWAVTACTASDVESNLAMKPLSCNLQVEASIRQGAEVLVTFSLKNQSETTFEVLQYHTPLEDLIGPVFEVRFEDEVLSYQGPMVKRMPPTDEDWLQLKPGGHLTNELDISLAWGLDRKGKYSLSLSRDVSYRHTGGSDVLSMPADNCPSVSFQID